MSRFWFAGRIWLVPLPVMLPQSLRLRIQTATPAGEFDPSALRPALLTLAPAAIGLALIVILGRLVLRPMFRSVARARARGQGGEMFVDNGEGHVRLNLACPRAVLQEGAVGIDRKAVRQDVGHGKVSRKIEAG